MVFRTALLGKKDYCLDCGIKLWIVDGMFSEASNPDQKAFEYKDGYRCTNCHTKYQEKMNVKIKKGR